MQFWKMLREGEERFTTAGSVVLQKERGHQNQTGLGSNLGLLLTI